MYVIISFILPMYLIVFFFFSKKTHSSKLYYVTSLVFNLKNFLL
jgi:hypothetical protein